jgi:UDP-2-acetamido-3-amino-2,3-dideoxy-glucuronate N-acetyltransferase
MNRPTHVFIHPTSLVETQQIGQGTQIGAFTHVVKGVNIGRWCMIGAHCCFEVGVQLGDHVTIQPSNKLWAGIPLTDEQMPKPFYLPQTPVGADPRAWLVRTHIQERARIGRDAFIRAGSVIGAFSFVNARASVIKNVPAHALVSGNPARIQGWLCQCGQPLHFQRHFARCQACDLSYTKQSHGIVLATF